MIPHTVQRKRVIVRDEDISMGEEAWKTVMRHVLGRHYADLQGKGPAWSFAHHHWDTFAGLVSQEAVPVQTEEVASVSVQTEPLPHRGEVASVSVQTEPVCATPTGTYLYNVEEGLVDFVRAWARSHNL